MSRLLVIGKGFVGDAVGFVLSKVHTVFYHDPDKGENYDMRTLDNLDGVILCLPTPSDKDGFCDDSLVVRYYEDIRAKQPELHIMIKSTTSISTLTDLQRKEDPYLTYSPEFLIAERARETLINSKFFLYSSFKIGGASHWAGMFMGCVRYCDETYYCDSLVETGFVKYGINSFLATKVTFMNELESLLKSVTLGKGNFDNVANLMSMDPRIGDSHMQVPGPDGMYGWGGACFPKDTSEFHKLSLFFNKPLTVLGSAIKANEQHRKKDAKNSANRK